MLARLLCRRLGPLLQPLHDLLAGLLGRHPVGLDALLAVGRQLGLPVTLAGFLLVEAVLLVAVENVGVGVIF